MRYPEQSPFGAIIVDVKSAEGIGRQYEGAGTRDFSIWKYESDKHIDFPVLRDIYKALSREGLVPSPEKDFMFVSPTANIPTHETALFELDQMHRTRGQSFFLVGDIAHLPLRPDEEKRVTSHGEFRYVHWDAAKIPLEANSVDMLWDRKGALWYAAQEGRSAFLELIRTYHDILRPGGSLIIDAIENKQEDVQMPLSFFARFVITQLLAELRLRKLEPYDLVPRTSAGQFEESTLMLIQKLQKRAFKPIADEIESLFTLKVIGKGKGRVCALIKK